MRETKIYKCEVCGHVHDEEYDGFLDELPKYANCPSCGTDAREAYKEIK